MANLSYADIDKHDFVYVKALLDKIKSGTQVKMHDNTERLFDQQSDIFKKIEESVLAGTSPSSIIRTGFKDFTKIDKQQFSGRSSGRSIAVTDESEQGVIIWLDIIVNSTSKFNDYEQAFQSLLTYYEPINAVLTKTEISHCTKWLKSTPDWNASCYYSALTIFNHFGSDNLKRRTYHQNSDEFNTIRRIGKELSKIQPDKWNPSDIYLIKKNFSISDLSKFKHLSELNAYVGKHDDIIGVQLKKQYGDANHGKAALNNISKIKPHIKPGTVPAGIRDKNILTPSGKKLIYSLTSKIMKMRLDFDVITRSAEGNLSQQLDLINIKSESYEKSIPIILQWLADHRDSADIVDSITYLVQVAMQKNPLSCAHMKCYGSDKKINEVSGTPQVKILRMRLKLSGDIDVIFDIEADDKPYKAQIRSFGSMPQLELKKIDNHSGWIPAKL